MEPGANHGVGVRQRDESLGRQHRFRAARDVYKRQVVFISHDLDEAMRIGDRIAIMQNGEVIQVGTPDEILNNPANDYVRCV